MSDLIAVAYEDVGTARSVLGELVELSVEGAITLDDAVIVERRRDGKVMLDRPPSPARETSPPPGALIGLLCLPPYFGTAVDAAAGGGEVARPEGGVDATFVPQLAERLRPGSAGLVVLVRGSSPNRLLTRISSYGGPMVRAELSGEADTELRHALGIAV